MIFIAHRGNTAGAKPYLENSPEYVDAALEDNFYVEVDVRKDIEQETLVMGHDYGEYELPIVWFEERKPKLFIHAKDLTTLSYFISRDDYNEWNVFWHQKDAYTLTTSGLVWAYPGSVIDKNCICVMPENAQYFKEDLEKCFGICSDNVDVLRSELGP